MMHLTFSKASTEPLRILCLGAHSDDIEIGCGGTLLQLARTYGALQFHWVVLSAVGDRRLEAIKGAELFTSGASKQLMLKEFRDGFLPYSGECVKDFFESLKNVANPDLIFTHCQGDAHQDHRLVSELTWNTFRNHLILEYEIPKYDGDLGRPSSFCALDAPITEQKVAHLFNTFKSQSSKPWFARETFFGLMRLRGMESNAPSGYAEAFHVRKFCLGGGS